MNGDGDEKHRPQRDDARDSTRGVVVVAFAELYHVSSREAMIRQLLSERIRLARVLVRNRQTHERISLKRSFILRAHA